MDFMVIRLTLVLILGSSGLGLPESSTPTNDGIRFSKLLNEKSEFLRFTSIARTEKSPRFQNVYNRAEDVQNPKYEPEANFPSSRLVTRPSPDEEFVRIRQTGSEKGGEETLTKINQKPISGRSQVTVLRQSSSGKRLNISPVFLNHPIRSTPKPQNGIQGKTVRSYSSSNIELEMS